VRPVAGEVLIGGRPVRAALRENLVAYVPQTEEVDWTFPVSVWDVVLMGRYGYMNFLRIPGAEDKRVAEESLARVGMTEFRERQIGELSGGQKKRVFLARALAQRSRVILLDVGSSVDPDEHTLAMHARLGAAYASVVHGIASPRVGLLTIGTERGKGDRLRRDAAALFGRLDLPGGARYVGLVEGNDVVSGAPADVVVTDGFSGNVLLKGLEAAYAGLGTPHPSPPPPRAAVLLGVAGVVVVCHGAASSHDVAAGIGFAASLHRRGAVPLIHELIQSSPDARGGS